MAVDLKSLQTTYKRYSHVYDLIFGAVFHPGRCSAVEHLHCQNGDRVLEVGVGTGLSLPLYPANVRVVGIDLSDSMLKKAEEKVEREQLDNVESLEVMDAQNMAFPDNSFDRVVAMYVASVVPDPKKLVDEIYRVCKPGGTIIFLNHFESNQPTVKKFEAFLSPFSRLLGFHPDFSLDDFLNTTGFKPKLLIPVNLFGYWKLVLGEKPETYDSTTEAPQTTPLAAENLNNPTGNQEAPTTEASETNLSNGSETDQTTDKTVRPNIES